MNTPTTQEQYEHAQFETYNLLERVSKQECESPATHFAAILTTTMHAIYDFAPSKEAAVDLISKCIELCYEYHKAEQEV
jgi:hypothetical protein